jgi:carbamoyltransferase
MRVLGISSQFHDAAVTVVDDGRIVFAAHSERYSRVKNDPFLNKQIIEAALLYGKPDVVVYHEKHWAKVLRNLTIGNFGFLKEISAKKWVKKFYPQLKGIPTKTYWHHETHAAAGVLTSDFDECAVMVIDAIGEFDSASIWHWKDGKLTKKDKVWYPSSLGLFYSAITKYVGLKPMEDEYILMGMAAYGEDSKAEQLQQIINDKVFADKTGIKTKVNLQKGFKENFFFLRNGYTDFDLAKAAQWEVEKRISAYAEKAYELTGSTNLVFMGGVALNCVANSNLFDVFANIHIMPNPGDAGSSLGAAGLHYYNATGRRVEWTGPYLGTQIPGKYPINKALDSLRKGHIFGIANGRAEFGPRALGNRSLIADPRGHEIQDRMNIIKKRQKFRPFAPMILEQHVNTIFEMPKSPGNPPISEAPYMQYVAKCKWPTMFPAIVHEDGTSRVQTVNAEQHPELFELLTRWYNETGCPLLVNTSLNIKGQPIVDNVNDAEDFSEYYGVDVHTHDDPEVESTPDYR